MNKRRGNKCRTHTMITRQRKGGIEGDSERSEIEWQAER